MKNIVIFTLLTFSTCTSYCQDELILSKIDLDSIRPFKKHLTDFLIDYNEGADFKKYLSNEVNFNGKIWMPINDASGMLNQLLPKTFSVTDFDFYNFDNVTSSDKLKKKAELLGWVFNNYSILADGILDDKEVSFVMSYGSNSPLIKSISIWDVELKMDREVSTQRDTIDRLKISIDIPDSFMITESNSDFIKYVNLGKTDNDEVIQIVNNTKQAELKLLTYRWSEYVTSPYRRSGFLISYSPAGYVYKYELIDENGNRNQGITLGIEHNDRIIFVQYFGLMEAYEKHRNLIDQMIREVKKF